MINDTITVMNRLASTGTAVIYTQTQTDRDTDRQTQRHRDIQR